MNNIDLNISNIIGMSADYIPAVIDKAFADNWFTFTVSLIIAIIVIIGAVGSIIGYYTYHRVKAKQRAKEKDKKYPQYAPYDWKQYNNAECFPSFMIGVVAVSILIICIVLIILSLWNIHMWTVNPDGMIFDHIIASLGRN